MSTYVFGDIEGNISLFNSTIDIINKTTNLDELIFMGDIYDYQHPNLSIEQIQILLIILNQPITYEITTSTSPNEIIEKFNEIYKNKHLNSYKRNHLQYLRKIPAETSKHNRISFIFGNKEVAFCTDIVKSKQFAKTKDNRFVLPVVYRKDSKTIESRKYTFAPIELNVMLSYLRLCQNYIIKDKMLFIHCYFNYRLFRDSSKFNAVMSGHSKTYGEVHDDEFPEVSIFVNDLTQTKSTNPVNLIKVYNDGIVDISYNV